QRIFEDFIKALFNYQGSSFCRCFRDGFDILSNLFCFVNIFFCFFSAFSDIGFPAEKNGERGI
ncbi:MAG: hypothetical protein K1W28_16740, partial [Lachnospiraceae bacterium]